MSPGGGFAYLLLGLAGADVLGGRGGHDLLVHRPDEALLRLGVEGHRALGQLLDAHGVVPLGRQHVLGNRQRTGLRRWGYNGRWGDLVQEDTLKRVAFKKDNNS